MTYDLLITGGDVVDGTNRPPFRADVAVSEGKIALVAPDIDPASAHQVIDATGRIVTPGFIDNHTHYDGQILWDPTLDLSVNHGYTTVIAGNCGMSLAPTNESTARYMLRLLSKVEGIPIETLEAGVQIKWETFGEMLDELDGRVSTNIGFLVGHSALRAMAMGDERCVTNEATPEEIAHMERMLREAIEQGGLGFSSSEAETHTDLDSRPIASRAASREEFLTLARAAGEYEGTRLEYVPTVRGFTDATREWLRDLSVAAGRQLDFPLLMDVLMTDEQVEGLLAAADVARQDGGEVLPQVVAQPSKQYYNLRSGFAYEAYPEPWGSLYGTLTHEERLAAFQDEAMLDRLEAAAAEQVALGGLLAGPGRFGAVVAGAPAPENHTYIGRTLGDVGSELGCSPFRALVTMALRDDLATVVSIIPPAGSDEREGWERRVRILRDNRGILSASDAGAHLDVLDSYAQSSRFIEGAVNRFGIMPIEEAVYQLTHMQAEFLGIRDRGSVTEGAWADLLVIDLPAMGTTSTELRPDLPAGGSRLHCENTGIEHIIINGVPTHEHGTYLGALAGSVLRSGRDTYTVAIPRY